MWNVILINNLLEIFSYMKFIMCIYIGMCLCYSCKYKNILVMCNIGSVWRSKLVGGFKVKKLIKLFVNLKKVKSNWGW